jgi:hypothetical protein
MWWLPHEDHGPCGSALSISTTILTYGALILTASEFTRMKDAHSVTLPFGFFFELKDQTSYFEPGLVCSPRTDSFKKDQTSELSSTLEQGLVAEERTRAINQRPLTSLVHQL